MQHSIAIDAMGGDYGIKVTVPASIQILHQFPEINIILVGKEEGIKKILTKLKEANHPRITIVNALESVEMDESPQCQVSYRGYSDSQRSICGLLFLD